MSQENKVESHSLAAKVAHWGFFAFFIFALTKQLDEVEELEDFALLQYELVFASVFLVVLMVRFVFMQSTKPTALPQDVDPWVKRLARAAHLGMYFCLAMIALTGLGIGGLYWQGIKSGGAMDAVLLAHEVFVITTYWLIGLHVVGAIYHRRKRDGVWDSMVPFWRETPREEIDSAPNRGRFVE